MIRLFALDIDGTLTDGSFYMDGSGNEYKRFHVRDGYGIVSLLKSGVEVAFISGRRSEATMRRAENLGVKRVINGTKDKLPDLTRMAEELGLNADEIAYMGDDVPDVACVEWAGLGIAVADAHADLVDVADWTTNAAGGRGAVREAADRILQLNAVAGNGARHA